MPYSYAPRERMDSAGGRPPPPRYGPGNNPYAQGAFNPMQASNPGYAPRGRGAENYSADRLAAMYGQRQPPRVPGRDAWTREVDPIANDYTRPPRQPLQTPTQAVGQQQSQWQMPTPQYAPPAPAQPPQQDPRHQQRMAAAQILRQQYGYARPY